MTSSNENDPRVTNKWANVDITTVFFRPKPFAKGKCKNKILFYLDTHFEIEEYSSFLLLIRFCGKK